MIKKIAIIGGGASGLMAAIAAARQGADVTIIEHMDRVGKKILSTGNGRCNMTNLTMRQDCYRSNQQQFPMKVLDKYSVWDTLTFFDEIGIVTKSKGGYIYPNSEQASAVLDALRMEAEELGVVIRCSCKVGRIKKDIKKGFRIETSQGNVHSDALIMATGSKAAPVTGSDGSGYELARQFGHSIINPLPALVQLRCAGKDYKQFAGVRCEAALRLLINGTVRASEEGELQVTDYGISGIPVFQISRFASVALAEHTNVKVLIDYLPSKSINDTRRFLLTRRTRMGSRDCGDFLTGVLNKKLTHVLLKRAGISLTGKTGDLKEHQLEALLGQLKSFEAVVTATNNFEQAQVCCGGVNTRDIRPDTMESKLVPGLYLTGELLDVDGICGGYNLQWAWSTGMIAGSCAGRGK
ncbi:MAG: NAD(P)/FAD-dependent oxidoreductase [Lachnospiraceae bacterium]